MGDTWKITVLGDERWSGFDSIEGNLRQLGPIADPIEDQDAATKAYVLAHTGGGVSLHGPFADRPDANPDLAGVSYNATDWKILYECVAVDQTPTYAWVVISENADAPWATQTDWSINASAGSNTALGTAAAPLATYSEYRRRGLAVGGFAQNLGLIHLSIVGNLAANDPIDERGLTPSIGSQINIKGAAVAIFSGTITAFTPKDPSSPDGGNAALLTDSALPVSWTASGGIGKIGVIQGGARAGTLFIPVRDMGSKQARISDATFNATADTFPFSSSPTFPTLQVGDAYTIFSCPVIDSIVPDVGAVAPQDGDNANFRIVQQFLSIANASSGTPPTATGTPLVFIACIVPSFITLTDNYYSCSFSVFPHVFASGYFYNVFGGASFNSTNFNGAGSVRFTNFVIQGGGGLTLFNGANIACNGDVGCFDSTLQGCKVSGWSYLNMHAAPAHLYGGGNAQSGIVLANGTVTYLNKPTLTGVSGDVNADGVVRTYATGIPYADPTTGSFFSIEGVTSQRTGTFTANGATPVIVPCSGIQATDLPLIVRTNLVSPGQWAMISINPGVSFTFQGTIGDGSAFAFRLK